MIMKKGTPKNLQEALEVMKESLSEDQIQKLKNTKEDVFSNVVHMGSGMRIRNDWGLWGRETEISKWFIRNGIQHADDKSAILTTALVRYVKGEDIRLDEQIEYYRSFWRDTYGQDPDDLMDYDVTDLLEDQ